VISISEIKNDNSGYYLYFGIDFNIHFKNKKNAKSFKTFIEREVNKRILQLNKLEGEILSIFYFHQNNLKFVDAENIMKCIEDYNNILKRIGFGRGSENYNVFLFSFIKKLKAIIKLEISLMDEIFLRKSDTVNRYNLSIINDKLEEITKGFISWDWDKFKENKSKILKMAV